MTALLPKWMMQDPLKILISKETAEERRSCRGCTNVITVVSPFGDSVVRCLKGRPYGKKCKQYEEADET